MVERKKLTDEDLKPIVDAELESAMTNARGELAEQRADAMERYLGEPLGTEMEGRSQVQARDVMETIEWILPTLITIFTDSDSAVDIEPTGPDDEEKAQQETDYLNHIFYKKNEGFLILYTWFKDALLSKNGITKCYVEENKKVTTESYYNLLDIEFQALNSDSELELIEHSTSTQTINLSDTGETMQVKVHDAVFKHTENDVRYCIDNIPPEEFVISKDARSPSPEKARFKAHMTTKTVSELREMGYNDEQIGKMEFGEAASFLTEESIARYNLEGEQQWNDFVIANTGMRKVKISECYLYADRNGDGFAESLKVIRSGDFIDVEEIEYDPFNAITPIILTHKFYGLSIADILTDLQEIRTGLLRSYMDNIYQTLNGKVYYDENTVNLDDMLTSKPYGLVANDGPPGQSIFVDRPAGLPPEAFTLNELLDKFQHNRVGNIQTQLDPQIFAQANTGVVLSMLNEAKSKVYMIARIFAETGLKPLFRNIHHLVRMYSNKEDVIKLRGNWLPINPREWKERNHFTVRVGLGIKSRHEGIADIQSLIDMQTKFIELGVPMVQPENIFNAAKEYAERLNYMPDKFFTDPRLIPPPPPQPDPNAEVLKLTAEVEQAKLQQKHVEAQMKYQSTQEGYKIKMQELEVQAQNNMAKQEIERLRTELSQVKNLTQGQKEQIDFALKQRQMEIDEESKHMSMAIEAIDNQTKNDLEKYKADLKAEIELLKNQTNDPIVDQLRAEIADLQSQLVKKPQNIIYDEDGRIAQVGERRVMRDASGRATAIE